MSMTKEKKIGLTVIGVLVIVFAVVIARRFMGNSETPQIAIANPNGGQTNTTGVHAAEKPLQKPTIISAKAISTKAGTATAPVTTVPSIHNHQAPIVIEQANPVENYRGSSRRTAESALLPAEKEDTLPVAFSNQNNQTPQQSNTIDLTPQGNTQQSVNQHNHSPYHQHTQQTPSQTNQQTPRELNLDIGPPAVNHTANHNSSRRTNQANGNQQPSKFDSFENRKDNTGIDYRPTNRDPNVKTAQATSQIPVDSFRKRGVANLDQGVNQSNQIQQQPYQQQTQQQPYRQQTQQQQVQQDRLGLKDHFQKSRVSEQTDRSNFTNRPGSGVYTVQPNDNFWRISRNVYGTGGFYKALVQHNRQKHPRPSQLKVGDEVLVPRMAELRKKYPDSCPKDRSKGIGSKVQMTSHRKYLGPTRIYVVETGDTLSDIAKYELGSVSRWDVIYHLNRAKLGNDFNHLKPGTELRIPQRNNQEQSPRQEPSGRVAREIDYEQLR